METVSITHVGTHGGKAPGDREDVSVDRARILVVAGAAVYSTVPDAKVAGADPDSAATKR